MTTIRYADFIAQNVAPKGVEEIEVYNSKGKRVGGTNVGSLAMTNVGEKLYSFAAVSDVHLQYSTAIEDFQRALSYSFGTENVDFMIVDGDLTDNGEIADLTAYKEAVGNYTVYEITGNHETYTVGEDIESQIEAYTGEPLYYSFEKGNDVFIMVGVKSEYELFTTAELQWLYETLETNRNRRCFVFQHVYAGKEKTATCGNAYGIYHNYCWGHPTQTVLFENLMKHYKNTLWFHGHSHMEFAMQSEHCKYANYDESNGYKSVHIPALSILRSGDATGYESKYDIASGSQGYIVDVYESCVVLRGRDFANEKFLPIAIYEIDTTVQTVEANTFTDSTGTINTN